MSPLAAAGFVIYRLNSNAIEYLLLKASYPPYHWTPPKGHVDEGETDLMETALRETEEEAGLERNQITINDFKVAITYEVKQMPKIVTYFLGQVKSDTEIVLSDEHTDYNWAEMEKAIEAIGDRGRSTGDVIRKCQNFIKEYHNIK